MKRIVLIVISATLIGIAGWLLTGRMRQPDDASRATIGIPDIAVQETPTPTTGALAMQDYKKIMNIPETKESSDAMRTTPSGLQIQEVKIGDGEEAVGGRGVAVHYTGRFQDGKVFDSSVERGKPFEFILGKGMVIKGWDEGVLGMKVGGKRKLIIPSALAYGEQGAGGVIPPNATLEFDVELLAVQSAAK